MRERGCCGPVLMRSRSVPLRSVPQVRLYPDGKMDFRQVDEFLASLNQDVPAATRANVRASVPRRSRKRCALKTCTARSGRRLCQSRRPRRRRRVTRCGSAARLPCLPAAFPT
jgi:hypothetical protein